MFVSRGASKVGASCLQADRSRHRIRRLDGILMARKVGGIKKIKVKRSLNPAIQTAVILIKKFASSKSNSLKDRRIWNDPVPKTHRAETDFWGERIADSFG